MELRDRLLDHGQDNDGIKEYDNPLPQWFMLMFYGTIVFSFLYMGYYTGKAWGLSQSMGVGLNLATSGADLAADMRAAEKARGAFKPPAGEALAAFARDAKNVSRGEALYKGNCVACHGEAGQGIVGPNLTDRNWIHGGKTEDIVKSIAEGWIAAGMPAWQPPLGLEKVHWLVAYVLSLKGRKVDNPKAPQGVEEP